MRLKLSFCSSKNKIWIELLQIACSSKSNCPLLVASFSRISFIICFFSYILQHIIYQLNILAQRNRYSGKMETGIPKCGNWLVFAWLPICRFMIHSQALAASAVRSRLNDGALICHTHPSRTKSLILRFPITGQTVKRSPEYSPAPVHKNLNLHKWLIFLLRFQTSFYF